MSARYVSICLGALIAVALPQASGAAEPVSSPSVTPLMERAFALHEQGPDQLRQFVFRTRMIYGLNQAEVVRAYEATRVAHTLKSAEQPRVAVAQPIAR